MMFSRPEAHEIQSVSTVGGDPTPIVGTFTLTFAGETTAPIPYDASEETFKVGGAVVCFSPLHLDLIPSSTRAQRVPKYQMGLGMGKDGEGWGTRAPSWSMFLWPRSVHIGLGHVRDNLFISFRAVVRAQAALDALNTIGDVSGVGSVEVHRSPVSGNLPRQPREPAPLDRGLEQPAGHWVQGGHRGDARGQQRNVHWSLQPPHFDGGANGGPASVRGNAAPVPPMVARHVRECWLTSSRG
jgi:hypothetical protein